MYFNGWLIKTFLNVAFKMGDFDMFLFVKIVTF